MHKYHFTGYPAYLDAAAAEVGRPEAAGPARKIADLAAIANLCAQAAVADAGDVEGILRKGAEALDQLRVAHRAAELMITDVRAGRGMSASPPGRTTPIPGRPTQSPSGGVAPGPTPGDSSCPTPRPPSSRRGRPSRSSVPAASRRK